jgi:hypothetical protein
MSGNEVDQTTGDELQTDRGLNLTRSQLILNAKVYHHWLL